MEFRPRDPPPDEINVSDTHPLKEAATLLAGLATVLALLAILFAWGVDLAVGLISPESEARAFGSLRLDWAFDTEDRRRADVERVLGKLLEHWPEAVYDFQVTIMEADEPNAAALPGGTILVTSALLDQVESENELAFVLGHELGHFRHRDHLRRLGRSVVYGLALAAVLGTSGGSVPDLAALGTDLVGRGFDRRQERAADRFGLELVEAAYGHVGSSWHFFQRLESENPRFERVIAYLSTHPASGERVTDILEYAEQRQWALEGTVLPFLSEQLIDGQ